LKTNNNSSNNQVSRSHIPGKGKITISFWWASDKRNGLYLKVLHKKICIFKSHSHTQHGDSQRDQVRRKNLIWSTFQGMYLSSERLVKSLFMEHIYLTLKESWLDCLCNEGTHSYNLSWINPGKILERTLACNVNVTNPNIILFPLMSI
jgi:hypothetical protein